jgi:hypothetical protein
MGYTLAMLGNPGSKQKCIGIFSIGEDGRVWVQTAESITPYKATMVSTHGDVIVSNCEAFLKELERQSKMSKITYYYTENEDTVEEYKLLLLNSK